MPSIEKNGNRLSQVVQANELVAVDKTKVARDAVGSATGRHLRRSALRELKVTLGLIFLHIPRLLR